MILFAISKTRKHRSSFNVLLGLDNTMLFSLKDVFIPWLVELNVLTSWHITVAPKIWFCKAVQLQLYKEDQMQLRGATWTKQEWRHYKTPLCATKGLGPTNEHHQESPPHWGPNIRKYKLSKVMATGSGPEGNCPTLDFGATADDCSCLRSLNFSNKYLKIYVINELNCRFVVKLSIGRLPLALPGVKAF